MGSAAPKSQDTSPLSLEVHREGENLSLGLRIRLDLRGLLGPYSGVAGLLSMAGLGSSMEALAVTRGDVAFSVDMEVILIAGGSPGSSSSTEAWRGCNCSRCRFQVGPFGCTRTLKERDPLRLVIIAGTQRPSLSLFGPK